MIDFSTMKKAAEYKNGKLKFIGDNPIVVVYAILVGSEYYIGSTVLLFQRIRQHLGALRNNGHQTKTLQNKFNEVGEFSVYILEECSEYELRDKEKWWINTYLPSLNGKIAARKPKRGHKINIVLSDFSFQVLKELKFIANHKGCDMSDFSISAMVARVVEEWIDTDYPSMREKYAELDRIDYHL